MQLASTFKDLAPSGARRAALALPAPASPIRPFLIYRIDIRTPRKSLKTNDRRHF
jgi:hypothetical protein